MLRAGRLPLICAVVAISVTACGSSSSHAVGGTTCPTFQALVITRVSGSGVPATATEVPFEDLFCGHLSKARYDAALLGPDAPANKCEQVAYESANPGYHADRVPAAPLKHVLASAGPCGHTG